jgi:hypothetical protein
MAEIMIVFKELKRNDSKSQSIISKTLSTGKDDEYFNRKYTTTKTYAIKVVNDFLADESLIK